jgi:hypothetical protein
VKTFASPAIVKEYAPKQQRRTLPADFLQGPLGLAETRIERQRLLEARARFTGLAHLAQDYSHSKMRRRQRYPQCQRGAASLQSFLGPPLLGQR